MRKLREITLLSKRREPVDHALPDKRGNVAYRLVSAGSEPRLDRVLLPPALRVTTLRENWWISIGHAARANCPAWSVHVAAEVEPGDVRVGLLRHCRRRVTQQDGHDVQRHALCYPPRRCRVAQLAENPAQAGTTLVSTYSDLLGTRRAEKALDRLSVVAVADFLKGTVVAPLACKASRRSGVP